MACKTEKITTSCNRLDLDIRGGMDSKGACLVKCPENPFPAFRVPRYMGCTHVLAWHLRCHWTWAGVRANGVMPCCQPLSSCFRVQGSGEYPHPDEDRRVRACVVRSTCTAYIFF
jgi:hypothetical protein